MDIAQYFDTTVTDCESGLAVRVILIPNASLAPHARDGLLTAAYVLGLRVTARLQSETEVVAVMSSLLSTSNPEARELAQAVATEPRLPFGEAGPQLVSLMAIARSAGDDLARTTSLVSMVDWRLLLVDAPAGMLVCGPAENISAALDRGMAARIREAMGLDGRQFRSTGPAAVSS